MAILQDDSFELTKTQLELRLAYSKFASGSSPWINATLTFSFGYKFPEITISKDGQEVVDMELFIKELRELATFKRTTLYFVPLEPDYYFEIEHSGRGNFEPENLFSVRVVVDAGSIASGVYTEVGPAISMDVASEQLLAFADGLTKELKNIRKLYTKEFRAEM